MSPEMMPYLWILAMGYVLVSVELLLGRYDGLVYEFLLMLGCGDEGSGMVVLRV